jgi:hypothetical protein
MASATVYDAVAKTKPYVPEHFYYVNNTTSHNVTFTDVNFGSATSNKTLVIVCMCITPNTGTNPNWNQLTINGVQGVDVGGRYQFQSSIGIRTQVIAFPNFTETSGDVVVQWGGTNEAPQDHSIRVFPVLNAGGLPANFDSRISDRNGARIISLPQTTTVNDSLVITTTQNQTVAFQTPAEDYELDGVIPSYTEFNDSGNPQGTNYTSQFAWWEEVQTGTRTITQSAAESVPGRRIVTTFTVHPT